MAPVHCTCGSFLYPCKDVKNVKVETIGLVYNFIILANWWNHDQRSMSKGCPQSSAVQLFRMDGQTDTRYRQADAQIFGITKSILAMLWDNIILIQRWWRSGLDAGPVIIRLRVRVLSPLCRHWGLVHSTIIEYLTWHAGYAINTLR